MPLTEMTEILAAKSPRRKGSSGLKITLKPFERIEIGGLTLVNGWTESSTFSIEGIAPVLRQANTIQEDRADTALRQVYLRLQKLYLRRDGATIEILFRSGRAPAGGDAGGCAGRRQGWQGDR
ncbi:flagellar biosynthesis repressor FlbT [Rhodopseudomonas sp.]|uniref:flagellar biosynthesis repressor FlbT n=1 Tax=Rhodopseudomonas sp. TaxID=1078 RepID=UPI0039E29505